MRNNRVYNQVLAQTYNRYEADEEIGISIDLEHASLFDAESEETILL